MAQDEASRPAVTRTGYWRAEKLELGRRYAYRPEFVPLLLEYLGAKAGMRVLDVGCGTGFLACLLAEMLDDVEIIGVDADERLLEVARQRLEREGLAERVSLRQGDAYSLPFPDESFDLVTSHTLMCILSDPGKALREQIRVARVGGVVSAITCFCHTDGLPHYHGRYPLPGNYRIDELNFQLWRTWRQAVRARLLAVDDKLNQDLLWQFRAAGLQGVRIDGQLQIVSPGDDRLALEEAADYALDVHRETLARLQRWWQEHAEELMAAGFARQEFEELMELKRARYQYLQADPARVREVMEVFVEPHLIVRGTRPPFGDAGL